jgi:hypothetical protein
MFERAVKWKEEKSVVMEERRHASTER